MSYNWSNWKLTRAYTELFTPIYTLLCSTVITGAEFCKSLRWIYKIRPQFLAEPLLILGALGNVWLEINFCQYKQITFNQTWTDWKRRLEKRLALKKEKNNNNSRRRRMTWGEIVVMGQGLTTRASLAS